jgi:hypothetical protein
MRNSSNILHWQDETICTIPGSALSKASLAGSAGLTEFRGLPDAAVVINQDVKVVCCLSPAHSRSEQ